MNRRIFKVISLILTAALFINLAVYPVTTAFAANKNGTVILEQTDTAETPSEYSEQPEQPEQPELSEQRK